MVLFTFVVCQITINREIPDEETFSDLKKKILECIVENEKTSPELRYCPQENLNNCYKETVILSKYR